VTAPTTTPLTTVGRIAALAAEGATDAEIARELGRNEDAIAHQRRDAGIPSGLVVRAERRARRPMLIAAMSAQGSDDIEIGRALGLSHKTVAQIRRDNNILSGEQVRQGYTLDQDGRLVKVVPRPEIERLRALAERAYQSQPRLRRCSRCRNFWAVDGLVLAAHPQVRTGVPRHLSPRCPGSGEVPALEWSS
jgi:DNA-binding CsgD family transcriptional regulator